MCDSENGRLWERQTGETSAAWAAFVVYRDLAPRRSIARVGQELGKSTALLSRWSSRWTWVLRAQAWDAERDRQERQEQIHAIHEMRKRHSALAMTMLEKAAEALRVLSPREISASQASRLISDGVAIERISRGLGKEQEPQDNGLEQSVDEKRRRMRILLEDPDAVEAMAVISHKLGDDGAHGDADATNNNSNNGWTSRPIRQAKPEPPKANAK